MWTEYFLRVPRNVTKMFSWEKTWNKSHWKRSKTISLLNVTHVFKFYMHKNKHLQGSPEFCKVNYDLMCIKRNTATISSHPVWGLWSFSVVTVAIFIKKGRKSNSQQWHKKLLKRTISIIVKFKTASYSFNFQLI